LHQNAKDADFTIQCWGMGFSFQPIGVTLVVMLCSDWVSKLLHNFSFVRLSVCLDVDSKL